jgi:hypothetical protein
MAEPVPEVCKTFIIGSIPIAAFNNHRLFNNLRAAAGLPVTICTNLCEIPLFCNFTSSLRSIQLADREDGFTERFARSLNSGVEGATASSPSPAYCSLSTPDSHRLL